MKQSENPILLNNQAAFRKVQDLELEFFDGDEVERVMLLVEDLAFQTKAEFNELDRRLRKSILLAYQAGTLLNNRFHKMTQSEINLWLKSNLLLVSPKSAKIFMKIAKIFESETQVLQIDINKLRFIQFLLSKALL